MTARGADADPIHDQHHCDDIMDPSSGQHSGFSRPAGLGGARPYAGDVRSKGALRSSSTRGVSPRRRTVVRAVWMGCSFLVLVYSIAVLTHVAAMGTIGVRCMFGTRVEEEIPADYVWSDDCPHIGDWLLSIGGFDIHQRNYGDYIRALRGLSDRIGSTVKVSWRDQNTEAVHSALVLVQRPPSWTYYRSLVWFLQEMLIFAIGARVFWKRPDDESAQLFFAVCIVTVGAFMGGYHWTEIVTEPGLIYPFALFAVFVPVVNLHFFLVFPRPNPVLVRHKRRVLVTLYGVTTAYLIALWVSMFAARWFSLHHGGSQTTTAFVVLRISRRGTSAWRLFSTESASIA